MARPTATVAPCAAARYPAVGELVLENEILDIPERGQRLVIYSAPPGSRSMEALRLLSVVGTQWP